MKIKDVIVYIEEISPPDSGVSNDYNKILYGNKNIEVKSMGVCWKATTPILEQVIQKGINFLIVHESIFYSYQVSEWYKDKNEKKINQKIKKLLDKGNICVYRAHSNWDCYPDFGVVDSLASTLNLGQSIEQTKFIKTYQIEPITFEKFASFVKKSLSLDYIRIYGEPNDKISSVTLLIGGFGGNQRNMPEIAKKHNTDVIIVGDLIENTLIYAQELGLKIIHTVHSFSEFPGIKNLYNVVKKKFPQIKLQYLDSGSYFFKNCKTKII